MITRQRTLLMLVVLGLGGAVLNTVLAPQVVGYPLDGAERSGIRRLLGYQNAQQAGGAVLPAGALRSIDEISLTLRGAGQQWDLTGVAKDEVLQAALEATFGRRDPSYAVAVVDISNPEAIAWAGIREDVTQLPGSVGKMLCLTALFDGLRRDFPKIEDRERVLRERVIEATDWALGDPHTVPKYDEGTARNRFAVVALGDRFRLSEWIDHMISASANSAGAMVWKEAMLLRHFGASYPPAPEVERAFFAETPKVDLTRLSQIVIEEPLAAAGIDLAKLRQGTMWTRVGQARIPGISSYGSAKEWVRLLLRIEQGRLVDEWSSLEIKRYLYMTKKRYRYTYAPELASSAVFFKSGSYYQCAPEEGFQCGKYRGNVKNLMNSIAIVESPAEGGGTKRYLVALLSNVLRVNSAWDHSRIAAAIEQIVQTRSAVSITEGGARTDIESAGRSD